MGAPEVAQKALRNASEFGLSHDSYKEFHPLMIYYSKQVGLSFLSVFLSLFGYMSAGQRPRRREAATRVAGQLAAPARCWLLTLHFHIASPPVCSPCCFPSRRAPAPVPPCLQGALQQMFEVFEFMRGHGRRPGPETCYILVKGCVDHGRPDLAEVRPTPLGPAYFNCCAVLFGLAAAAVCVCVCVCVAWKTSSCVPAPPACLPRSCRQRH